MTSPAPVPDLAVNLEDRVATVEIRRPPNNFFDSTRRFPRRHAATEPS